ncbi:MAG: ABC transporter ATP-binding protein [bacterium]|nr:ABC transporter ATP-binding protein [bacterium]
MAEVTEMTNWAVDLIDVHKTYSKDIYALRGVNIQVGRGEIFGLLGPNGAGKSTLVKIMMTVVRPSKAMGTVLGRRLGHRKKLQVIGYLPESHRFPSYLTGRQLLIYYAALGKVPRPDREKRATNLLGEVGLAQWADTRLGKYSKGMAQRLGIAQALMNDPELVVLDEPTDGLDPMGRRDVRELLLALKHQGKTVFLNSHLLSELEMVCDRVSILVEGLVSRQGTLDELTEHTVEYRITARGDLAPIRDKLSRHDGKVSGDTITVSGHDAEKVNAIVDVLRANGNAIESIVPYRFSLEDIFVEAMGQDANRIRKPPVARRARGVG